MLQLESLILYFFLLVLGILFNFCSNIGYKQGGFFEILLKKSRKFEPNKRDSIVIFNLSFVLLPVKVDFVAEKQG